LQLPTESVDHSEDLQPDSPQKALFESPNHKRTPLLTTKNDSTQSRTFCDLKRRYQSRAVLSKSPSPKHTTPLTTNLPIKKDHPQTSCPIMKSPDTEDIALRHPQSWRSSRRLKLSPTISTSKDSDCVSPSSNKIIERLLKIRKTSTIFNSAINQWVIKNALRGRNKLHDEIVEILAILTSTTCNDVIYYLVHNGWYPTAADPGICYVRIQNSENSTTCF